MPQSNVTFKVFVDKMGGTDISSYIGTVGEVFYDPFVGDLKVSNGVTAGGTPITGSNAAITLIDGGTF
jgi:hypothetical protein